MREHRKKLCCRWDRVSAITRIPHLGYRARQLGYKVVVQSGDLMIPEPEGYLTLGIAADNQQGTLNGEVI